MCTMSRDARVDPDLGKRHAERTYDKQLLRAKVPWYRYASSPPDLSMAAFVLLDG
jgi:hypothetical protein